MRHLPWIIAVRVGAAIIVLAYPVLQTQRQLWSVESELRKANEQAVEFRSASAALEGSRLSKDRTPCSQIGSC